MELGAIWHRPGACLALDIDVFSVGKDYVAHMSQSVSFAVLRSGWSLVRPRNILTEVLSFSAYPVPTSYRDLGQSAGQYAPATDRHGLP